MGDAEDELKKIIKTRTNKKANPVCIFVKVREAKDIVDLKMKETDGVLELRVHSTNEHFPKWYTHGYLIAIPNLRLNYKDIKKKEQILDVLTNPNRIKQPFTKQLISKLDKDFGGIISDGKKLFFKTEKFKKKKDPFKVRMKTM
ncbi:MAG: hypothetical protein ACTSWX_05855 [Promethearchaeota archaeon]